MAFSLSVDIHTPPTMRPETVRRIVEYAHSTAQLLGFAWVAPVIELGQMEILEALSTLHEETAEISDAVRYARDMLYDSVIGPDFPSEENHQQISPSYAIGFSAKTGRGCSILHFVFVKYPPEVVLHKPKLAVGWHLSAVIYEHSAHRISPTNFVQCHLRNVTLFRQVKRRFPFLQVCVDDEGEYWRSQNLDRLLDHIDTHERLLAAVFGALQDGGMDVEVINLDLDE
ncbi:MAG: hypothetical protein KatS3mg022_0033 [Armatimonadota bacterium]|nr:MAG: hypothetical protein KatS3mg022_0033 [Armatimonadota bacterium]